MTDRSHEIPQDLRNFVRVVSRSEEHTSELQSRGHLVCRLPLEKKKRTSRSLERSIRAELPEVTRTDIHLEPMEPAAVPGHDGTARNVQLAERIRAVVEAHPAGR